MSYRSLKVILIVIFTSSVLLAQQSSSTLRTTPYTRSLLYPNADANDFRGDLSLPVINVKDSPYLAKGDGVTDDSAAFTAAIAASPIGGTIFLPNGEYLVHDITINKLGLTLQGVGMSTILASGTHVTSGGTIIKCGAADSTIFDVNCEDVTWSKQLIIKDLALKAYGSWPFATSDCNALLLGNPDKYLTGRLVCERVTFVGFKQSVKKLTGNIGNVFLDCVFDKNEFGLHGKAHASMHAGNDYFERCHFSGTKKAVFYYDQDSSGYTCIVNNCIIEANPGFVFFVKEFRSDVEPGIVVSDTLFEANSNYGSDDVVIDANTYTAAGSGPTSIVFGKFNQANAVTFTRCMVDELALSSDSQSLATQVYLDQCHLSSGFEDSFLDANSALLLDERCSDPNAVTFPLSLTYRYRDELLASETFQFLVQSIEGHPYAALVPDAPLFSAAQAHTQDVQYGTFAPASITAGKYVFAQVLAKWVSGTAYVPIQVRNSGGTFSTTLTGYPASEWTCYTTITYEPDNENDVRLWITGTASATVLHLGGYQLLQFDTYDEALEYRRSRQFAVHGVNHLLQTDHTIYYTIDLDDDASTDDYQFDDDAANQTEQVITLTDILPAYCELVSWQVRCFETVTSSTSMQIDFGTSSGGAEIGTGNPDTANDIITLAAGGCPALAATNAARSLYFSGTPGANWNTLDAGRWFLIMHLRRNDLAYIHKNP